MYLGLTLTALFLLSLVLIGLFKATARSLGLVAIRHVNEVHQKAIPVGAGAVFIFLWFGYVFYTYYQRFFPTELLLILLLPSGCMALVGFLDDMLSLAARWRLVIHLLIAVLFIVLLGDMPALNFSLFISHINSLNIFLALLALVWSTNLFNFMDGIDGMAALQGCYIFLMGGVLFFLHGEYLYTLMTLSLAVSLLGFLFWNWPVAKIFMGDVGSTCLGFLIVVFCILAQKQGISVLFWFMLYEWFFIDATLTLIRRLIKREDLFSGHKNHAFHRLLTAGWSNRKILYGTMGINGVIALLVLLAYYYQQGLWVIFLAETALLMAVYWWIERQGK